MALKMLNWVVPLLPFDPRLTSVASCKAPTFGPEYVVPGPWYDDQVAYQEIGYGRSQPGHQVVAGVRIVAIEPAGDHVVIALW